MPRLELKTAVLLLLALACAGQAARADGMIAPRLQIGLGLLPAVIAANKHPRGNPDGERPVYIVYEHDAYLAARLQADLEASTAIRGRGIEVRRIALDELLAQGPSDASVLFLAEPLDARFDDLVRFSHARKLLLFSPFEGDVARGAGCGFRVTDKVRPAVNLGSLRQSNIHLKAFFLRIAVKHE